jgi:heme exporter protein A
MYGKPTLSLDAVSIERGGRQLISDLSLELSGPKLLWVVGGNGIGKTSLLRTCAGLSQAADGNVSWTLDGALVTAPQCVSFLPSDAYAKPGLRAHEEAAFWNIDLKTTGLSEQATTLTQNLSTGQAKRLSFAKILADKKPIWILDEPLAGLDEDGRQLVAGHLQAHVKAGGLALIASHAPIAVNNVPTKRLALG